MVGNAATIVVYVDTVPTAVEGAAALLRAHGLEVRSAVATNEAEFVRAATDATAVLVGDTPITAGAIDALPHLRMISAVTVGVDHIDLRAASAAGIEVGHVPGASTEEVATTTMALILGLVRHTHLLDRAVRAGGWDAFSTGPRRRPSTLTLGIVGYGRIGRAVATLGASVFGRVLACDPVAVVEAPAAPRSFDELLAASDVVSLHAPGPPAGAAGTPLIDADALRRMRPGAYLVNVARGALVDADALLAALNEGHLAGAALDVLDPEPPDPASPLLAHPRVIVNPHAAFWSVDSEEAAYRHQAENVIAWLTTGAPITPVPPAAAVAS